jgi:hypothetical protein
MLVFLQLKDELALHRRRWKRGKNSLGLTLKQLSIDRPKGTSMARGRQPSTTVEPSRRVIDNGEVAKVNHFLRHYAYNYRNA